MFETFNCRNNYPDLRSSSRGQPHSYLSSPYGSEMGGMDNQGLRGPPPGMIDNHTGYPPQPPPSYSVNPRNGYRLDDPYNDQVSSVGGDDVNPLDERFSEQSSELGGVANRYRGASDLPMIRESDSHSGAWPNGLRDDTYRIESPQGSFLGPDSQGNFAFIFFREVSSLVSSLVMFCQIT